MAGQSGELASGLIDQCRKLMMVAVQMALRKDREHPSWPVAARRQSLSPPTKSSIV